MQPPDMDVRDLGRIDYDSALALQRELQASVIDERVRTGEPARRGYLLLLEHDPPVVTVTKRRGAASNVLVSEQQLAARGIQLRETDRGGDVTYHGPGQLVAYVIVDINRLGVGVHGFMRLLEQAVIDTLARAGLGGERDSSATGVWVGMDGPGTGRKICALGVRFSRYVSMHGLALNVNPDLGHFDAIVPCGLKGRPVTSIAKECGGPGAANDIAAEVPTVKVWISEALTTRLRASRDFQAE
ncbi:MAG: lipoyl(octanoyl) transferase LipB [Planctomycetota bacterium]|nr:lipoyl(octanoyl) transferase LipB [Planctomycetota bacterium]MDA1105981.1 lipoyl(octanoyl) transferase LipB [Planctomycetota bacterium]